LRLLKHYAHSRPGEPVGTWQELADHLEGTSTLAEEFAFRFAPGWGLLAGLWHDAGKYRAAFQRHIGVEMNGPPDEQSWHAVVGALLARERKADPLVIAIAGHHGGLRNLQDTKARLERDSEFLRQARRDGLPPQLEEHSVPQLPSFLRDKHDLALWIRFVFSALVDADFLDTERFYNGGGRELHHPSLAELRDKLNGSLSDKERAAEATTVNGMRSRVLQDCRAAAAWAPGAFTLTVPTGGGKTLASMAFALDHAIHNGLDRVIVVIPYTSIIEQTAQAYREVFGDEAVVEHHSSVDPDRESQANRMASENWDAPVIVTTSVQFFESLYANRTSRCRKLHRISGSVVVFDEVQTFPPALLQPIRSALGQLIGHYGVSAVFCTATQPALRLPGTREIVSDVEREFAVVRGRCEFELPASEEPLLWEALAGELRERHQVLAIVHKRADAENLARLTGEDCIHLSSRMCAEHRSRVIEDIRKRLREGETCRVVSTQLVEAGVDVDFPEVYRAFAGADSLAQAAGRCNREGLRPSGRCRVFIAPSRPPRGILQVGFDVAFTMWKDHVLDLTKQETFRSYFDRLYGRVDTDPGVIAAERELRFEDSAQLFRMIEEHGEGVIAPFGDWQERFRDIEHTGLNRFTIRRLQRLIVNLYPVEIARLDRAGAISRIEELLWRVNPGYEHIYDARFGVGWQGDIAADPEAFII
jgi:CRISPR-associated endonuclease/helicase Cas3